MPSEILFEKRDSTAFVSFNNPAALNALTSGALAELKAALEECERSGDVASVVLRGEGGRAFSAGADIHVFEEFRDKTDAERYWKVTALQVHTFIEKMTKPVVAVITGYALGGGLEIALCCDYIIASDDSKLGFPEINLGLIPGWGGTQRIARIVGRHKAKELIMLGEMIDAKEAHRLGIVNKVVPREDVDAEVQVLIAKLSDKSKTALAFAKEAVNFAYESDLAAGLRHEARLDTRLIETEETKGRIKAFLERRKPTQKK